MKVYIVFGQTGEYSDRSEWMVCGYKKQASAQKHANEAALWADLIKEKLKEEGKSIYGTEGQSSPYDAKFRMGYSGTEYYVVEVDMVDWKPHKSKCG